MATSSAPLSFIQEMFPRCGIPDRIKADQNCRTSVNNALLFIPKDRFPKTGREQARAGGLGLKTIQDSAVFAVPD